MSSSASNHCGRQPITQAGEVELCGAALRTTLHSHSTGTVTKITATTENSATNAPGPGPGRGNGGGRRGFAECAPRPSPLSALHRRFQCMGRGTPVHRSCRGHGKYLKKPTPDCCHEEKTRGPIRTPQFLPCASDRSARRVVRPGARRPPPHLRDRRPPPHLPRGQVVDGWM